MSNFAEYDQYDGMGLAELVKKGSITSSEVCEAAISRAEKINPKLNAIITPLYDFARQAAAKARPEGPFSGVPFLLKDVHHALEGYTISSGSRALKDKVADHDAEIVKRFKRAGLIIMGKTNTPEFKLASVTEPEAFGPTRNPWNTNYSPGGSSGGSAAAVAARIVPFASATDEGGSIRIPAAYCGVFGLKPSRGRNPVGPDLSLIWGGMSTSHVITRSVRDSAAILDAVSGPEPGGRCCPPGPEGSFLGALQSDPKPLNIGYHTRPSFGHQVHPECVKAVEQTCKLLETLGHRVEETDPGYSEEEVALNWCIIMIGHLTAHVGQLVQAYGRREIEENIELTSYALYRIGQRLKVFDFIMAERRWQELSMIMDQKLNHYDMILSPTLGMPPVLVGSQKPSKADQIAMKILSSPAGKSIMASRKLTYVILEELLKNAMKKQMFFTMIANITGLPAMSVPLHWTADGLPCGVQFIGRYGDEAALLKLASQLETAQPWSDRKPSI
jgi:amidase